MFSRLFVDHRALWTDISGVCCNLARTWQEPAKELAIFTLSETALRRFEGFGVSLEALGGLAEGVSEAIERVFTAMWS